jgi:hypothetical protein
MAAMKEVNPWTWQDKLQFSQAIEVRGGSRVLYCVRSKTGLTRSVRLQPDD